MQALENIFDDCGLTVHHYEHVHGGNINNAYCLFTPQGKYFLKVNDEKKFPAMFEKEARGLNMLRKYCSVLIPQVINHGACDNYQYLLLEWLEKGNAAKNMWDDFGSALASMHKQPQLYFGLNEDNYIGSIQQINSQNTDWPVFYTECRIKPLVKILFDKRNFLSADVDKANSFCKKIKDIFPGEPPSLLHGDLWAGNFLIASSGNAAIYDPAVYYGHREMDIGMTKLFGGFDQRFYHAYHETYPLEKGWEKRLDLSQLYPLLVHAVLFGGHYISSAISIFRKFS